MHKADNLISLVSRDKTTTLTPIGATGKGGGGAPAPFRYVKFISLAIFSIHTFTRMWVINHI